MEAFEYSMKKNQFKRYKAQRWIFLIMGIVYILQSVGFYYDKSALFYTYFLGGVFMMIIGFYDMKYVGGYKIAFDENGIIYRSPGAPLIKSGNLDLKWSDLKSYYIAPLRIELILKDDSKKAIPLDALGYNDVHLVKENFLKFAEKHLGEK